MLLQSGREDSGQLSKRTAATGSISQFELRLQNRSTTPDIDPTNRSGNTTEDEFDSLWPSL